MSAAAVNLEELHDLVRKLRSCLACLERALDPAPVPTGAGMSRVQVICQAAAIYFDVAPELITCAGRTRQLVTARHAAIYFARRFTDLNQVQLARHFRRDHAAISHALRAVRDRIATDTDFTADMHHLENVIRQRLNIPTL